MTVVTRSVLQAIRGNDFEVELRRVAEEVGVRVIDHRRNAESSFSFNAENEEAVIHEVARRFCSANQRVAIYGEVTALASDGPYRYEVV